MFAEWTVLMHTRRVSCFQGYSSSQEWHVVLAGSHTELIVKNEFPGFLQKRFLIDLEFRVLEKLRQEEHKIKRCPCCQGVLDHPGHF